MKNLIANIAMTLLCSCTTVTYPNGTVITAPYTPPISPVAYYAPLYAAAYGTPGYPVPIAPYSPPGTIGYLGGGVSAFGIGWGNWWSWRGGGCYGGNNHNWNGGYGGGNNYTGYRGNCGYGGCHYGH